MAVARSPDGGRQLTLRLDPEELGRVEIRIDRPAAGPARVEITVEKTDTLNLLLHDQQQLQRALDQAGVPPDGRSVTFHVATPEQPMAGSTHGGGGTATSSGGGESRGGSGFRQGGTGQNGGSAPDENRALPVRRWLRAGVDITA